MHLQATRPAENGGEQAPEVKVNGSVGVSLDSPGGGEAQEEEEGDEDEELQRLLPLVNEFFEVVARTGRPQLAWPLIQPAIVWKIQVFCCSS